MTNVEETAKADRHFRRSAASGYLSEKYGISISAKTLAKWACVASDGPEYRMFGRTPLYPKSSLDAWALKRLGPLVRSTTEAANLAKHAGSRG